MSNESHLHVRLNSLFQKYSIVLEEWFLRNGFDTYDSNRAKHIIRCFVQIDDEILDTLTLVDLNYLRQIIRLIAYDSPLDISNMNKYLEITDKILVGYIECEILKKS